MGQAPYVSLTKAQRVALATILFKYVDSSPFYIPLLDVMLILSCSISCVTLQVALEPVVRSQHVSLILRVRLSSAIAEP